MNLEELERICVATPLTGVEEEEDEYELSEEEINLNEALALLEDCRSLLAALDDPLTTPKGKISSYFKREITKTTQEVTDLLLQYNIGPESI